MTYVYKDLGVKEEEGHLLKEGCFQELTVDVHSAISVKQILHCLKLCNVSPHRRLLN